MAEHPGEKRSSLAILRADLDNEFSSFESHFRDLSEYVLPRRAQFTITNTNTEEFGNQANIKEQNFPLSHDQPRCLPCSNGSASQSFNPEPYKPNSNLQGIGNDTLPPIGVDFLSDPAGVYSQSQIGYQFGMT